jgi:hypothetical protein
LTKFTLFEANSAFLVSLSFLRREHQRNNLHFSIGPDSFFSKTINFTLNQKGATMPSCVSLRPMLKFFLTMTR